ncbi:MAG: hemerythrin domain-containing protein [Planctomycetes bacterium]|nr:hemerythrin domain-containing protein [Planctomycetota bacterium]
MFYGVIYRRAIEMRSQEKQFYFAFTSHLRSEHRLLRESLEHVQQRWNKSRRRQLSSRDIDELADSLAELRAVLAHHFAEEESGGCIEEAVTHAPQLSRKASQLEHEDSSLLQQLDDIIRRLRARPKSIGKIEKDYRRVHQKICDHADAESRIVEEGLGTDVD